MALNESLREIFFHNKMMSQVMQAHKISFTTQCEHKFLRGKIENENVAIFIVCCLRRFDRLRKNS
jgi:hypothetical protein